MKRRTLIVLTLTMLLTIKGNASMNAFINSFGGTATYSYSDVSSYVTKTSADSVKADAHDKHCEYSITEYGKSYKLQAAKKYISDPNTYISGTWRP